MKNIQQIKTISYLSFKIGKEHFAANVRYVQNILELTDITEVPKAPDYMLGIINLRGMVLPLVDMRIKLGLPNTEKTSSTCILVLEVIIEKQQVFIGALVDSVSEVLEIDDSNIKDSPGIGNQYKSEFISGVFHDGNKFILLLEMNNFFSSSEVILLQEHNMKTEVNGV